MSGVHGAGGDRGIADEGAGLVWERSENVGAGSVAVVGVEKSYKGLDVVVSGAGIVLGIVRGQEGNARDRSIVDAGSNCEDSGDLH